MLFKLIKHNLKPILKSILPFIALLLVSIILFNLTDYETYLKQELMEDGHFMYSELVEVSGLQQILHDLFSFMISSSIILLIAITIKSVCYRFKVNFYSDRAYLTHTLPVTRNTLWNAQICTMVIAFICTIASLVLGCFMLLLSRGGTRLLDSFGLLGGCTSCVGDYYHIEPRALSFYLAFVFILFIEFSFLALCGMFGTIMKNRTNKNIALLAGVGIYILGNLLVIGIFYLIGALFDGDVLKIFDGVPINTPSYSPDVNFIARAIFYIGSIYTGLCTILYFTERKLLHRGINLD